MLIKPSTCSGCPLYEQPYGKAVGWVPADGTGQNGVLIVLEAAGSDEEIEGRPVVGRAGHYLFSQLARVGLERDNFKIHNVLSCRPPDNKLAGMPYEAAAINHCSPNLDSTIIDMQESCKVNGKTFVILCLGRIAFKHIMGFGDKEAILKEDYLCYPHRSDKYQAWVLAVDHPAYMMRGNHHLVPLLQFAATRAVQIAAEGLSYDRPYYKLDPDAKGFNEWVDGYYKALAANPDTYLSYDIETPGKQGKNEESIEKEDRKDYTILRVSFAHKPGDAVSIAWKADYLPAIQRLFASNGPKIGWNSSGYDDTRIKAQGIQMNGDLLDGMLAWHVLNSALPKGLGFVTPFYWKNTEMWKHLADSKPSFYNAKDADAALRCWLGIKQDLQTNSLWHIFDRHIIQVNRVFQYMSKQGVLLDQELRNQYEQEAGTQLREVEQQIQDVIPDAAKELKIYKKEPKDVTGMVQVRADTATTQCPNCLLLGVRADHFKSVGKKRLASGSPENPCHGLKSSKVTVPGMLWGLPLPFKISKTSLTRYQKVMDHKPVIDRKEKKVTFDEKAIIRLGKTYPKDPLYKLILKQRGLAKLLGTYIGTTQEDGSIRGGMPVGSDGRVHTTFSRNPETLRSASSNPNLQNLPR